VVREPVHVYKFFGREPGGPTFGLWVMVQGSVL